MRGGGGLEVGFCDSASGSGFLPVQPADQLERWAPPIDNGSHLLIPWSPHESACGLNVSTYFVDVRTSTPLLNAFIGAFGTFPQDLCDPSGSKAREAAKASHRSACAPYPRRCASAPERAPYRVASFEVPAALRQLARLDIEVTVRAYGSLSPLGQPERRTRAVWWCHKYRRSSGGAPSPAPTGSRPSGRALASRLSRAWRGLRGWRGWRGPPKEDSRHGRAYESHRRSARPPRAVPPKRSLAPPWRVTRRVSREQALLLEPSLVAASAAAFLAVLEARRRVEEGRRADAAGRPRRVPPPFRSRPPPGRGVELVDSRRRGAEEGDARTPIPWLEAAAAAALHMAGVLLPCAFVLLVRGATLADLVGESPTSAAASFWLTAERSEIARPMHPPQGLAARASPRAFSSGASLGIDWCALGAQVVLCAALAPVLAAAARSARERGWDGCLGPLVAWHALALWRWGVLFAWCLPALTRSHGGTAAAVAVLAIALAAERVSMPRSRGGEAPAAWALRCTPLAALVATAAACGTFLAACPAAWAVDQATAALRSQPRDASVGWRDVGVQFGAAATAVVAVLAVCGEALPL